MLKLAVIIPAAGSGTRMGSRLPKPFIKLGNVPILAHTLSSFLEIPDVVQVIVATSKEWFDEVENIYSSLNAQGVQFAVVEGGSERQFSINNAFSALSEEIELVAVHDAVRPFIKKELIIKCAEEASRVGAAMIGVPAKDTIKKIDENQVVESTPDRRFLWQAQTPQIFKREILEKAYASAIKDGFLGTDDASVVERIGQKVKLVEGDRENLKITYPVDLKIAELILNEEELF
ncbi:MAG: 2-C-methyl-D-erythritol 4-phosphate cytidylyltransferase [Balneolales bacterium]|nr:2-C-methyl-D-erythritol 4-phosphate cytidylyltransferase [Balneolales bacterium]